MFVYTLLMLLGFVVFAGIFIVNNNHELGYRYSGRVYIDPIFAAPDGWFLIRTPEEIKRILKHEKVYCWVFGPNVSEDEKRIFNEMLKNRKV